IVYALQLAPKHALPMDVLRTIVSALSFYDPEYDRSDHDANVNKAIRLTSQIAMILHADHELNASTFAARVTAATLSDMHSAVTSAIGTLKGPLHGGANE